MKRPLTPGEIALARSVYGDAIDYAPVRVVLGKWAFFQPRHVVMTPVGNIHYHPRGGLYHDDLSAAPLADQGLFIHELCHVRQHQRGVLDGAPAGAAKGGVLLPLRRHPFCRYDYAFKPGQRFERYGLEQQAEIARHAFLLRRGAKVPGAPGLAVYEGVLPFKPTYASPPS